MCPYERDRIDNAVSYWPPMNAAPSSQPLLRTHQSSYLQNDGHDQRSPGGFLHDVALQVRADFFLDHAPIGLLLAVGGFQRFGHYLAGALHEVRSVFASAKPRLTISGRLSMRPVCRLMA